MTLQTVLEDLRKRPGAGDVIQVIDPATEEPITEFTDCGTEAVNDAVARAKASFESGVWSQLPGRQRAKVLWKIGDLIDEHAQEFAELDSLNTGMPLMQAQLQMSTCSEFFRYYAGWCSKLNGTAYDVKTDGIATDTFVDMHAYTLKEPFGVVGLIFPWNGPIFNASAKLAPALAAGGSMLVKPAEETPLSALLLDQLVHEAGVPEGVVNLLTGYGHTAGAAITAHAGVEKVAFTGSTEVGKTLAAQAAGTVKRVSLELGGHAPFLVFDDADPVHAAKGAALVKFLNTGQACISPNRIFVQRGIYPEFVRVLTERVGALRTGNGADAAVSIGPLIDEQAVAKMERHTQDAVTKGARLLAGGHRLAGQEFDQGTFFAPTVLSEVTPEMLIYREETFGPIAAVTPFDDEKQAIQMANDTAYGLASYVYTRDLSRAIRVCEALRFAIVGVNDINPTSAAAPFGGTKESGLGREGGREGIAEYLDTKLVGLSL